MYQAAFKNKTIQFCVKGNVQLSVKPSLKTKNSLHKYQEKALGKLVGIPSLESFMNRITFHLFCVASS